MLWLFFACLKRQYWRGSAGLCGRVRLPEKSIVFGFFSPLSALRSLFVRRADEVIKHIREHSAHDAKIVVGASYDDKMTKGFIQVTWIASGVSGFI